MTYKNMNKLEQFKANVDLRKKLSALDLDPYQSEIHTDVLQQAKISYQASFNPEFFCRLKPDLSFSFVNDAFTSFYELKPEEIIGQSLFFIIPKQYHDQTKTMLSSLNMENAIFTCEYMFNARDDKIRWRQWTTRAIFDEIGKPTEYQCIGRDITEQKEAEEQLLFRLAIEEAIAHVSKLLIGPQDPDIDHILKIMGQILAVNRAYMFELRENGRKMVNIFEWCDSTTEPQIAYLQDLDVEQFTWGLSELSNDGIIVIPDISALPPEAHWERATLEPQGIQAMLMVPINSTKGELLGYMGLDDTEKRRSWKREDVQYLSIVGEMLGAFWERKQAEKALIASEEKFRTLADTAPAIIFVWSQQEDYPLVYLNSAFQSITGFNSKDSLNNSFWDFVHPDYQAMVKERGIARLQGEHVPDRYEVKFMKYGGTGWGDLSASPILWEGKPAVIGTIYDISERKKMEEELWKAQNQLEARVKKRTAELVILNEKLQQEISERKQAEHKLLLSEARYRAIVEDQTELVVRALPDLTIAFANKAYCRFYANKHHDLIGTNLLSLVFAEDQNYLLEKMKLIKPNIDEVHTLRTIRNDGKICWQEWNARAIYKNNSLVEYQAVGRDITERIEAEEALKRSENNFRKLAENSPALIYVFNKDRLLYMNSTALSVAGCNDADIVHIDPWEFIHPECREQMRQSIILRRQGETVGPYETKLISRNGQEILGYLSADLIDYEGQEAILGIIVDITERKKMEEELMQASKLESLGILAGGIAHDFNNILTIISGNISLAKMIIDPSRELHEILLEVDQATIQARDLTQQLLTFSKGGAPIKEAASIQELLKESTSFVLRGSNVNCKFAIPDDLWTVVIDKGQFNQVINNLVINADQAMPDGGTIKLSAKNISLNCDNPLSDQAHPFIKITIADQGIGIAEDQLSKIFDPYFTTKQQGHGLGLPTCYSIIKKHGGDIRFYSELGLGTTVDIFLPACPELTVEKKKVDKIPLSGQGKILIMDDEVLVRETLGKMLTHLGYQTVFAADGFEAIELYQKNKVSGQPCDAVIMDLTIAGGMGGKEAVRKLLELDSQAKVIVSSGYSNDPVMADFEQYGFRGVIPKPYEIERLNEVLFKVRMGNLNFV